MLWYVENSWCLEASSYETRKHTRNGVGWWKRFEIYGLVLAITLFHCAQRSSSSLRLPPFALSGFKPAGSSHWETLVVIEGLGVCCRQLAGIAHKYNQT